MDDKALHTEGLRLFGESRFTDALHHFAQALGIHECADYWNDWGMAQLALEQVIEAEKGFRRALALDAANSDAVVNLAALLGLQQRFREATQVANTLPPERRPPEVEELCRQWQAALQDAAGRRAHRQSSIESAESPQHFLVIHEVLPHVDRSGSDVRLMRVIRGLRDAGHQVTYIARNGKNRERYGPLLQELEVRVYSGDAERITAVGGRANREWTLADVFSGRHIDAAILFHWFWSPVSIPEHYISEIRRISPATKVVVLSDDRHAERERRYAHLTGNLWDQMRAQSFHYREEEIYRAADLVIAISEDDRRGMLQDWPGIAVEVLPMRQEVRTGAPPSFGTRRGVLFVGNFDNVANRDGIRWLLDRVWPEVLRRVPGITLTIAGNGAPANLADDGAGIHVVGHVPELDGLLDSHRVMAAPIRFGTGIKTKVLSSLAHGLPVVTTTIGGEGLDIVHGEHALIADEASGFAAALAELYANNLAWEALQRAALAHVGQRFSSPSVEARLAEIIRTMRSRVPEIHQAPQTFSVREIEDSPNVQSKGDALTPALRFLGHSRRGLELLAQGQSGSACIQFEHAAWYVREAPPAIKFYIDFLTNYALACRNAGQLHLAAAAERDLQEMVTMPVPVPRRARRKLPPELSVIVPTYQRPEKLERCLDALQRQTLSSREFEVIVVDDGSAAHCGIEDLCASAEKELRIKYVRQANSGAGAARRAGVGLAAGKYLLLINDDTIASRELLAGHLALQQKYAGQRVAMLGDFVYPPEARKRALTHALGVSPLMFPQRSLSPANRYDHSHFVTCNLSVERAAVEACGSFDPSFRVAEDTELGVRLESAGYGVVCDLRLKAEHDHLPFRSADWIRRARSYGAADFLLFRKHPALLGNGSGPFLRLDQASMVEIVRRNETQREQIEQAVAALEPWDDLDFEPLLRRQEGALGGDASGIVDLFCRLLPAVHWFYLYEALLLAWETESATAATAVQDSLPEEALSCSI